MEGKESLRFQSLPSTEIDIFHYRVKMYMCHSVFVCVCASVYVCGSGFVLAADGEEVIHLVISKSLCVCVYNCVAMRVCVYVCVERGGKVKKHDLWKGVVLKSSRYSNACKS